MTGQEFKSRITIVLAKKGLNQSDVARMLGISQQAFNNRFLVKDVPSGFIEKVCEALNVSILEIYPEVGTHIEQNFNQMGDNSIYNSGENNGTMQTNTSADREIINQLLQQNAELIKMMKAKL